MESFAYYVNNYFTHHLKPSLWGVCVLGACRLLYRFFTSNTFPKIHSYKDKVVLITGASQGLGRSLAIEFHARGARLILAARGLDKLKTLADELTALHPYNTNPVEYAFLDLANLNGGQSVVDLVKLAGPNRQIDVLVNNAGIAVHASCNDTTIMIHRQCMEVNYFGQITVTQALIPFMAPDASMVMISSVQAKIALPHRAVYGASKHAITAYCDALRAELAGRLHVLDVMPGYIATNLSNNAVGVQTSQSHDNLKHAMSPEYAAGQIVQATADRKNELVLAPITPRFAILMRYLTPDLYFRVMAGRAVKEKLDEDQAKAKKD